jgi:hypothetical protein
MTCLAAAGLGLGLGFSGGCEHHEVRYEAGAVAALPAGSFTRLGGWMADLKLQDAQITRIDVRDDTIFVFSSNHRVTAINRGPGSIRFVAELSTADQRLMPPVELKDLLVFPTATTLELYDKNGVKQRSVPLQAPIRSGAVGSGDRIYFGADDPLGGRLQAVDLSRSFATVTWELLNAGGSISSTPALYLGVLFVGTENPNGVVYAVNEDRRPIWSMEGGVFTTAGPIVADLKADESGLYIACKDTKLYCVNRANGKLLWQYFAGRPLTTAPIPTADTIYQFVDGEGIAAISKDPKAAYDRPAKWVYKPGKQFLSQDEHYAYVMEERPGVDDESGPRRVIVAVDKQTGQKAFESKHQEFSVFGTNARDNTIYAAYPGGLVFAIKPVLHAGQIGELVLAPVREAHESVALSN